MMECQTFTTKPGALGRQECLLSEHASDLNSSRLIVRPGNNLFSFLSSPRKGSSGSSQTAVSSVSVSATTKFTVFSGSARPRRSVVSRMASMIAMPWVSG